MVTGWLQKFRAAAEKDTVLARVFKTLDDCNATIALQLYKGYLGTNTETYYEPEKAIKHRIRINVIDPEDKDILDAVFLHELVHVFDRVIGWFGCDEDKADPHMEKERRAITIENRYRKASGLLPRTKAHNGKELPEWVLAPTGFYPKLPGDQHFLDWDDDDTLPEPKQHFLNWDDDTLPEPKKDAK